MDGDLSFRNGDGENGALRLGIDLVSVERIARLGRELGEEGLTRIFGGRELEACRSGRFPERLLAERFAAKEACLKLFPEETASGELQAEDIPIFVDREGPRIEPGERLLKAMERRGIERIAVSTASCRTQALAMAVVASSNGHGSSPREAREDGSRSGGAGDLARSARSVEDLRPSLLGRAIHSLFPVRRRTVLANMRRVFGDLLDGDGYRRLAQAFYDHMGLFILETVAYSLKPIRRLAEKVRVENMEIPLAAGREGRGLIILTGHFGNWEIACAAGSHRFPEYRGKFHFLRRPISTRWIESLVIRRFRRAGLRVIPKKNSLFEILGVLERNEVLVFIMDQHASVPKDGIAVEFFGEPAGTFRSLALIAKATGAPVIPAHSFRDPSGNHVLRFLEPIPWICREDPDEEILLNTRAYNRALERMVLLHPEQWFWMHKRWKLRSRR